MSVCIQIMGEQLAMYPEKILSISTQKIVLVSDLHFGKVNHFRKAGIAVPIKANQKNASVLIDVINRIKPDRVIFLGDLFHSTYNQEWETIAQITQHFSMCSFELVKGNHDILGQSLYKEIALKVVVDALTVGNFILTHEPMTLVPIGSFNIAGHIHPGIRLRGGAGQALMLPCFYFKKDQAVMPAFGSFTGLAKINPAKGDQIFAIASDKVIAVSSSVDM